jgi:hypothetical protein
VRPKEAYLGGRLWFMRIQGILYGEQFSRTPDAALIGYDETNMQSLKNAYNMLKIDLSNLRAI